MVHKVHQKIYRIKEMGDWLSRGFYGKNFPRYLEEDFKIRELLKNKIGEEIIASIEMERFASFLKIIIKTSRPALIIGRGGEGVEKLKKIIEKEIKNAKVKREIKIEIQEVKNPWLSAKLTASWMVVQIERRVPFRRVIKMALTKIMSQKGVEGARVEVAGRLNGVEIARTEWLKEGKLPRNNLRADIDYGTSEAHCTYGVIGIKVWIYKGEKF